MLILARRFCPKFAPQICAPNGRPKGPQICAPNLCPKFFQFLPQICAPNFSNFCPKFVPQICFGAQIWGTNWKNLVWGTDLGHKFGAEIGKIWGTDLGHKLEKFGAPILGALSGAPLGTQFGHRNLGTNFGHQKYFGPRNNSKPQIFLGQLPIPEILLGM